MINNSTLEELFLLTSQLLAADCEDRKRKKERKEKRKKRTHDSSESTVCRGFLTGTVRREDYVIFPRL